VPELNAPDDPARQAAWAGAPITEELPGISPADLAVLEVVSAARSLLGAREVIVDGRRYPPADCGHYVRAAWSAAGVDLMQCPAGAAQVDGRPSGVACLWAFNRAHGALGVTDPRPGDLVYFDDTYDRDGNGARGDRLTHVGLVEERLADGTVVFLHMTRGVVRRARLNLQRPHEPGGAVASGRALNDYLRVRKEGDPPGLGYLTGELFAGYGRVTLPPASVVP